MADLLPDGDGGGRAAERQVHTDFFNRKCITRYLHSHVRLHWLFPLIKPPITSIHDNAQAFKMILMILICNNNSQ